MHSVGVKICTTNTVTRLSAHLYVVDVRQSAYALRPTKGWKKLRASSHRRFKCASRPNILAYHETYTARH